MIRYIISLVLLLQALPLAAQLITGSIVGSVQDPTRAAVPGAQITLQQVSTGRERTAESDTNGNFAFGGLEPGEYQMTAAKEGFKRVQKKGLHLTSGERLPAGVFVLELGTVSETVSVTARTAVVQTESAERADVITGDQAENLLTLGRNVVSLVSLLPGVVNRTGSESLGTAMDMHVLGGRQRSNNISVDGAPAIDVDNGFGYKLNVSQDAVAEVKILVSNYQAEYGRMAGSNVQIVTKSGTQQFHGMGSYYKRHEQFNATDFFDNRLGQEKPRYRYNTWTYNVGGPIYIPGKFNRNKDKLFFFWQQEFWPITTGSTMNRTVPTALERAGDYSQTVDLNGQQIVIRDPSSGQPFPGNVIPASRLDPSGTSLLKLFPLPNFFDRNLSKGQFNYVFASSQDRPQSTNTLKIDYNINPANSLVWSYSGYNQDLKGNQGIPGVASNWPQFAIGYKAPTGSTTGRYTHIFSPTFINEFQFAMMKQNETNSYSQDALSQNQRDAVGFAAGQFSPSINPLGIVPNATFGGVPNPVNMSVDGRFPFDFSLGVMTFDEKATLTRGSHTLKAGIYIEHLYRDMPVQGLLFNGSINFGRNVNNPLDTNYAFSNASLGVFNTYSEGSARPTMLARTTVSEFFVQDNWKVSKRLTLDYGVRFYWVPPIHDANDLMTGFVPGRFDPSQQVRLIAPGKDAKGKRIGVSPVDGSQYPAALIGAIAPGFGNPANGMVTAAQDKSYPNALTSNPGLQFAPRIGFAYDVFGNGKTAIRGGFGMFYNRESMAEAYKWLIAQPPLVNTPVVNYGLLSNLRSSNGLLFPSAVLGRDPNSKLQQTMNFSFSVQQDIGFGTVLDVGYVGSLGRHLIWRRQLNPIPAGADFSAANADPALAKGPLPPAFLRPMIGYNDVNMIEPAGSSNYHSLQVTARRRFTSNLQFGFAWTWSKTMDFVDGETDVVNPLVNLRDWNYGLADFDRTHVVKINMLYDLPKLKSANRLTRGVLGNWQVSGITSFVSGAPLGVGYSQVVATDITGTPSQGARIVVTGDPVLPKSERTFNRNFNTSVFQMPAVGTFGNAAKTLIRGPGINNWDIALLKNLPIWERVRAQFRCEMYNAFNHTQFDRLDTTARFDAAGNQVNGQFGQFTSAAHPRYIQLALRFIF